MPIETAWTDDVLRRSGVLSGAHWVSPRKGYTVYITKAYQLVGAYAALRAFRTSNPSYRKGPSSPRDFKTWDIHHVMEEKDVAFLRPSRPSIPRYEYCPCVLLPVEPHRHRIDDFLDPGPVVVMSDIFDYKEAYDMIGNYTGAGERNIRDELLAIYRTILATP